MTEFPYVTGRSALHDRAAVLATPCPVPNAAGIYAWFFKEVPPRIETAGCFLFDDLTLLYVGISPKEPPANGRLPSRSMLRQRLRTHYAGNAEGSTLRRTLGCLLGDCLGLELRRVGSGGRYTFTNPGERVLDRWMQDNAFVAWREQPTPWVTELSILRSGLSLPLNVHGNPNQVMAGVVQSARSRARRRADELPIVVDSGGARRGGVASRLS